MEEMKLNGWFVRDKEIMVKILKAGNILHQYVPILRPGGGETSSKSLCFMLFFDKNRPSLFKDLVAVGEDIRLCTGVRLGDDEWCQDLKVEAYRNLLSFMCKPTQEGEQQQVVEAAATDPDAVLRHQISQNRKWVVGITYGKGGAKVSCVYERKEGQEQVVVRSLVCSHVAFQSKSKDVDDQGVPTGRLHIARALSRNDDLTLLCHACYSKPYRDNLRHHQGQEKEKEGQALKPNTNHRYMDKAKLKQKIDELSRERDNAIKAKLYYKRKLADRLAEKEKEGDEVVVEERKEAEKEESDTSESESEREHEQVRQAIAPYL